MSIDKQTVDHWTTAIALGATPPLPSSLQQQQQQSPRQQALGLLISADWLLGEAREQGLKLSGSELARRVREQSASAPGGRDEFQASLATLGETSSDVELEARVRWAASEIQRLLSRLAVKRVRGTVTAARVHDYYRRHLADFRVTEQREFDLAEGFPTPAAARAFVRRLGLGRRFAKMAIHEIFERPDRFDQPHGKGPLLRAIFSAHLGVASAPMHLNYGYVVFVLRHVRPASVKSLAAVRGAIERQLLAPGARRAYSELLAAYVRKWTLRTACQPRYVVQQCRDYRGGAAREDYPYLASDGIAQQLASE